MESYLDSINVFLPTLADEKFRKFDKMQREDLADISTLLIQKDSGPSLLIPLIKILFGFGGFINSTILGQQFSVNTAMLIERILEDYHDESLQILNEEEIDEKALRSVIFFFKTK